MIALPKQKTEFGFYVIAAIAKSGGIGKDGKLPWKDAAEMAYFKSITSASQRYAENVVVMGRNTWISIEPKYRPLSNRLNVVISSADPSEFPEEVCVYKSFEKALSDLKILWTARQVDDIFVIGGARLYEEAVKHESCSAIFLSHMKGDYDCDVFFPKLNGTFIREAFEDRPGYAAAVYSRSR